MLPCEQVRDRLLDHVYGLLDPSDEAAVAAHLAGCDACSGILARTRKMQGLFAAAAKAGFPDAKFQVPDEPQPVAEPAKPARSARSVWLNWVVAASLVLVVAGTVIPTLVNAVGYAAYRPRVNSHLAKLDQIKGEQARLQTAIRDRQQAAEAKLASATKGYEEVERQWITAEAAAVKRLAEQPFLLDLRGPATAIAGAPNEYQIAVTNADGSPVTQPVSVVAKVRDAAGKDLFTDTFTTDSGARKLKLPAGVWSKIPANTDVFFHLTATDKAGAATTLVENLRLLEPTYTTFLTTDKPMYRPGETVYFRSLTLDRVRFLPPERDQTVRFEIKAPSGQVLPGSVVAGLTRPGKPDTNGVVVLVPGPDGKPIRGVGSGAFTLPANLDGGEYTLNVFDVPPPGSPPAAKPLAVRKFLVNKYTPDKLLKKLEFDGKSYGPGDVVQAKIDVKDQGQPLAGATLTVEAVADGREVKLDVAPTKTEADGTASLRFTLPKADEFKQATVSVQVQTPAVVETLVRPVPLATRKLNVEFFPEGGDLLVGVPNRVYFRATTGFGKPADVTGTLTDGAATITTLKTLTDKDHPGANQGVGAFEFTPEAGKTYAVKLDKPIGLIQPNGGYKLPAPKGEGVVLHVPAGVTKAGEPIRVRLHAVKDKRTVLVGAYIRGRSVAHEKATVTPGQPTDLVLNPGDSKLGGVTRVTVFDLPDDQDAGRTDLKPLAERLVFRTPGESLKLSYTARKPGGTAPAGAFVPGARVDLEVVSKDETGAAKPAVLWAAVVNQSVITMADEKTERLLPTHFLLSGEVQKGEELEHADFLLTDHPKAAEAIDLLLGTQGWRRFAEQQPAEFRNKGFAEEADRLQIASTTPGPIPTGWRPAVRRVFDEYWPKYEEALAGLELAERGKLSAYAGGDAEADLAKATTEYSLTQSAFAREAAELVGFDEALERWRSYLPILFGILGGLTLLAGVVRFGFPTGAPQRRTLGYAVVTLITALGVVGLLGLLTGLNNDKWRQTWTATPSHLKPSDTRYTREMATAGAAPPAPKAAMPDVAVAALDDAAKPMAMKADGGMAGMGAPGMKGGAMPAEGGVPGMDKGGMPGGLGGRAMPKPADAPVPPPAARAMRAGLPQPAALPAADPAQRAPKLDAAKDAKFAERREMGIEAERFNMPAKPPQGQRAQQDRLGVGFELAVMAEEKGLVPADGWMKKRIVQPRQVQFFQRRSVEIQQVVRTALSGTRGMATATQAIQQAQLLPQGQPLPVREYAHTRPELADDAPRTDFTETLLWHPLIVTPTDGKATVSFSLSDDVAPYRVLVAGHTLDGRIGAVTGTIEVRKPFALDPKLPPEISSTDVLDVPVLGLNGTDKARTADVTVTATGLKLTGDASFGLDLAANSGGRKVVRLAPEKPEGELSVQLDGKAGGDRDSVVRTLTVVPDGFPAAGSKSDVLEQRVSAQFPLPEQVVPGTLKVKVTVYPNTLSEVQSGLEGMLREPYGCFEQTSTTNYPNVLVLDYLTETNQAKPDVSRRAKELLDRGYGRLISFECQKPQADREGYEWFGGTAPPHEALTAYGLLQFTDMARVHPVDAEMLKRTKQYLLDARDGKGGFKKNPRALDTFGYAPAPITDAYIVWAISESERKADAKSDLDKEVDALLTKAKAGDADPYFLGLVANALLNRGKRADGERILKTLAGKQDKDGAVPGAKTTITNSRGEALLIETTGMAVLGWLKANEAGAFRENVDKACKWIGSKRSGHGAFGSTQSTILALKALIEYARSNKRPAENGTITVTANGKAVGSKAFTTEQPGPIVVEIADPEKVFANGKLDVAVETDAKQAYPCTVSWECRSRKPASADQCPVRLETTLNKAQAAEGEPVRLTVKVTNLQEKQDGMVTAIVGLPAGLKVPEDLKQLKLLTERPADGKRPTVSYWEKRGRELVFYWHGLHEKEVVEFGLELIADVPGEYRGPAGRAYLYYGAEHKHWVDPLAVKVTAK
jgi:anti-sigma factor RsiW